MTLSKTILLSGMVLVGATLVSEHSSVPVVSSSPLPTLNILNILKFCATRQPGSGDATLMEATTRNASGWAPVLKKAPWI